MSDTQTQLLSLPNDANLLEINIYLASLASDPNKVDTILDPMRQITAQPNFQQESASHEDVSKLQKVGNRLADYLIHQESVRAFTREDLERRLRDRFAGTNVHSKLYAALAITFTSMILLGAGCLLVKPPAVAAANADSLISFYILLSLPTMFTVVSLGAAWLFFSALRYFKAELKYAYMVIACGVALLGAAHLQMPILAYISTLGSGWIWDGAVGLVYLPAHLLILVGTAIFARKIHAHSQWSSWPAILASSLIGALIVIISTHTPAKWSELFFDFATGTFPLSIAASAAAAINCYLIAQKVNDIYRAPMKWLGHANALLALTVLHILIVRLVFGYDNFWTAYGLIILPYFISSALFLRASYSFNKVSNY